jgi:Zn-finger nucleic acid-binding protein
MEPYRSAGLCCPICADTPLREFQGRLICDECHGMLLDGEDLAKACGDLINKDITLEFTEAKPTAHVCPKCESALSSCEVRFAPVRVKANVLRCERDGVWLISGMLAGIFALLGRKTRGVFGSRSYDPGGPPVPGFSAAPTTAGLRISEWRTRPRRREPTLTPINAYRDQCLACPACTTTELKFYGDRYACAQCAGTFVQNAAFEAMAMDVSNEVFQLPPPAGTAGSRACPVCNEAMVVEDFDRVPIDRCAAHGIWFDANELAIALERASGQFEHGWRAWIRRVFA